MFVSLTDFVIETLAYSSRKIVTVGFGESVKTGPVALPSFALIVDVFVISLTSLEIAELTLTKKSTVTTSPASTTELTTKVKGLIEVGMIGVMFPLMLR